MQISFRLTGVFSLTLMQNRIYRGVGYADLQDGPYTSNIHKIALFWRNSSKLECIQSGNADFCFSREKQWQRQFIHDQLFKSRLTPCSMLLLAHYSCDSLSLIPFIWIFQWTLNILNNQKRVGWVSWIFSPQVMTGQSFDLSLTVDH